MIGLIFDVDGTIWNSTDYVAQYWTQASLELHPELNRVLTGPQLMKEFGQPMDAIMDHIFPELSGPERIALEARMYFYENEAVKTAPCHVYEGILDTIKKLSEDYEIYVVSNCQSGYIEAMLENTKLEAYVKDITCFGDNPVHKGENIRAIMEKNGVEKAVYIGDTNGDREASEVAGVPFIYVSYGFGDVKEYAAKVDHANELLKLDYEAITR